MKSCIYVDMTKKYHCFELCPLFCANDDVTLAGYQPAIIFKREKTIARGQEKCDFHFYNSKKNKVRNKKIPCVNKVENQTIYTRYFFSSF